MDDVEKPSPKKSAHARVELAWVHCMAPTRAHLGETSPKAIIIASDKVRLFLDELRGVPTVVVESPGYRQPARIPLTSVASYGMKE